MNRLSFAAFATKGAATAAAASATTSVADLEGASPSLAATGAASTADGCVLTFIFFVVVFVLAISSD
jgi:hypothetical protein